MKHGLRFLVILAAVITLMIMTASIALAHPDETSDGIVNAVGHAGQDAPLESNSGKGNGGLWGNPATADSEAGSVTGGIGADAMLMQVLHNPTCSGYAAGPHEH